ncbi:MAG: hypothetical protein HZB23_03885 [Deltaproteobacteria bacterium]|nr:hypothetical protein [Deltaproteobacteria bacterium]
MKTGKGMSFDGMVKFFLHYYRIPTRKDIEKLMDRIDQLEKLIKVKWSDGGKMKGFSLGAGLRDEGPDSDAASASDLVLSVVRKAGSEGASFAMIKQETGFADKKLRNIIFRLNKLEKISRKERGTYVA